MILTQIESEPFSEYTDTVIKSELRQSPLLNNVLLIRNFINIPEYIYMDEERQ